jgi:hypothetical protein
LTGFAVGDMGTIIKTTDGGATWTLCFSGTQQPLNSVVFTNDHYGYAAGENGTILTTIDGGSSWVIDPSGTTNILYSMVFTGPTTGYAVGDGGTIINTTSGGTDFTGNPAASFSRLHLYPNPSLNIITVDLSASMKNNTGIISIYSTVGGEIFQQKIQGSKTVLNVSSLPPDIYFVKYVSQGYTEVGKFVKE